MPSFCTSYEKRVPDSCHLSSTVLWHWTSVAVFCKLNYMLFEHLVLKIEVTCRMRFMHTGDFETSSGISVGLCLISKAVNDPVSTCYLKTKLGCNKKSNCGAVNDRFVKCGTAKTPGLKLCSVPPHLTSCDAATWYVGERNNPLRQFDLLNGRKFSTSKTIIFFFLSANNFRVTL